MIHEDETSSVTVWKIVVGDSIDTIEMSVTVWVVSEAEAVTVRVSGGAVTVVVASCDCVGLDVEAELVELPPSMGTIEYVARAFRTLAWNLPG